MYMYIIPLINKWEGTEVKFVAYLVVTLENKGDDILSQYYKYIPYIIIYQEPQGTYLVPGSSC
jgi:hypothetical protein